MKLQPIRILLVEDNEAHAELVRRAFASEQSGRLTVASTLREARAVLERGEPLDLVIADWRLPDGEGLELLREIAPETSPVVIMTSQGNERVAVEAMRAGALDYVVKTDASLADLPHIARRALDHWSAQRERTRIREQLSRSEDKYRHLVEDIPDVVYVVDRHGAFSFVSHAVAAFGYDEAEIVGKSFVEFFEPSDHAALRERLAEGLAGRAAAFDGRFRTRAGEVRWGWSASRPVLEDGRVVELRGVLRDITDRKQSEQALEQLYRNEQRLTERLRELSLMKTNFLIVTSHEVRTPITVLRGYVEALLEGYFGAATEAQAKALHTCLSTVDRMVASFNDILQMLQLERGARLRRVSTDLAAVIDEVVLQLRPFIEKRLQRLTLDVEAGLPSAEVDPDKLRVVFTNLVQNAIKFTPDSGEIGIELRLEPPQSVRVTIRDNGVGIEAGEMNRIFEPFYTSPDARHHSSGSYQFGAQGFGLGLAIVRGHVEAHGGRVWAESSGPKSGARFHVVLPMEAPPEAS